MTDRIAVILGGVSRITPWRHAWMRITEPSREYRDGTLLVGKRKTLWPLDGRTRVIEPLIDAVTGSGVYRDTLVYTDVDAFNEAVHGERRARVTVQPQQRTLATTVQHAYRQLLPGETMHMYNGDLVRPGPEDVQVMAAEMDALLGTQDQDGDTVRAVTSWADFHDVRRNTWLPLRLELCCSGTRAGLPRYFVPIRTQDGERFVHLANAFAFRKHASLDTFMDTPMVSDAYDLRKALITLPCIVRSAQRAGQSSLVSALWQAYRHREPIPESLLLSGIKAVVRARYHIPLRDCGLAVNYTRTGGIFENDCDTDLDYRLLRERWQTVPEVRRGEDPRQRASVHSRSSR